MTATVIPFARAAAPATEAPELPVLRPGVWLYSAVPASEPDAVLVVRIEGDTGGQVYSVLGGMRPLPRTRVLVRTDGGAGAERWLEHVSTESLRAYRMHNGLTGYYGFLDTVFPIASYRDAFIARRASRPVERMEEARRAEEERERQDREIGPWFTDVVSVVAGDRYLGRPTFARIVRRALRELVGVKVSATCPNYSMARGVEIRPPKGSDGFTDSEAERIASVFPLVAWRRTRYDHETGESREVWVVEDRIHPTAREDRSDGMTDYYDPGGFRIAPAHLLAVSAIIAEEAAKR